MKYDLLIKNGVVILEDGAQNVEVGVKDGKIAAIGQDLGEATQIIDAENQIVSPGMVDAHVHITEPGGGYRDGWEGYWYTCSCKRRRNFICRNAFKPSSSYNR